LTDKHNTDMNINMTPSVTVH